MKITHTNTHTQFQSFNCDHHHRLRVVVHPFKFGTDMERDLGFGIWMRGYGRGVNCFFGGRTGFGIFFRFFLDFWGFFPKKCTGYD